MITAKFLKQEVSRAYNSPPTFPKTRFSQAVDRVISLTGWSFPAASEFVHDECVPKLYSGKSDTPVKGADNVGKLYIGKSDTPVADVVGFDASGPIFTGDVEGTIRFTSDDLGSEKLLFDFDQDAQDCRDEVGVTTGLIDSLIAIARILAPRLRGEQPRWVVEALKDFAGDEDVLEIQACGSRARRAS